MIITKDTPAPTAGPSYADPLMHPPPSFEESAGHVLVNIGEDDAVSLLHGGEDAPPEFTPYDAEVILQRDGTVVSHDPHLNRDGEALYRFLLSQATEPPTYVVRCTGSHTETRTDSVRYRDNNGRTQIRHDRRTETVTDFSFAIDIGQHIVGAATHWSIADSEPAYRGRMFLQTENVFHGTKKASRRENKTASAWKKERTSKGLPPWVGPDQEFNAQEATQGMQFGVLKSSWSLRQWADDYCASDKYLKEFVYEKMVYGWNTGALEVAIRSAILATGYKGRIAVSFDTSANKVVIRPDTRLSRMLSNTWWKLLLVITLVLPFLWLWRRFSARGGGRWEVCGGAYALKQWRFATDDELEHRDPAASFAKTAEGMKRLVGTREGEWFRTWEGTIQTAVGARTQEQAPMRVPLDARVNPAAAVLDGYL